MRTPEEIREAAAGYFGQSSYVQAKALAVIAECLIDIRDLLNQKPL